MEQRLQDVFRLQTRKLDSECSLAMGIQFARIPPRFPGVMQSQAQGESVQVLQEEILSLLEKGQFFLLLLLSRVSDFFQIFFLNTSSVC